MLADDVMMVATETGKTTYWVKKYVSVVLSISLEKPTLKRQPSVRPLLLLLLLQSSTPILPRPHGNDVSLLCGWWLESLACMYSILCMCQRAASMCGSGLDYAKIT